MPTPFGHCYRFLVFDREDEYEDYIIAATRSIQADASDYSSLNNRGVAYLEIGKTLSAVDDFTAACRLAPHEYAPRLNLASVLEELGDLEGALAFATEAVRVDPTESTCYFVRGGIYQQLGDQTHAEEDFQSGNRCRIAGGDSVINE